MLNKQIPEGYHAINVHLVVKDVAKAIEFYQRALGAVERSRMAGPDGKSIMHATLRIGDSNLMLGPEMGRSKSVEAYGGSPISLYIYVPNADEAFKKAIGAGGKQERAVEDTFWGDRCGVFVDPFGLQWTLSTHQEDLSEAEMEKRAKEFFKKQAA